MLNSKAVAKQGSSTTVLLRIIQSWFFTMGVLAQFDLSRVPLFEWSVAQQERLVTECEAAGLEDAPPFAESP